MGNIKSGKSIVMRLFKLSFRIFLGIVLVALLSGITLIIAGYVKASKTEFFFPEINQDNLTLHTEGFRQFELKNSNYLLCISEDGRISVKTIKGEVIMSNLSYYSSYEGADEKWGLDNLSLNVTSDTTLSINGEGSSGTLINILLTVPKHKSKLDVCIKTLYRMNTTVFREALIAGFDVPVSEIYRKNRQIDYESFEPAYWLQKQGVRFGSGIRSALIYHTPFVSSLQLDTKRNLLYVNLDYYLDHPFYKIPFQEDGGGRWIDLSTSLYHAGEVRNNSFSVNFGDIHNAIPRIMLVPNGYLAGYVFTEHADGGNMRTHRAAYFGSEDILNAADATGGFVGHKIPVTKSIFYNDLKMTTDSSTLSDSPQSQLLRFLDQLNETGDYDIGLHGSNANRKGVEESIKFMKDRFGTKTWIDHGMFSGKGNRQSFIADGLDPDSEYFTADLWEKYGTTYFWNSAVEEFLKSSLKEKIIKFRLYEASVTLWKHNLSPKELREMRFDLALKELIRHYLEKGELNSLLPKRGDAFPTPLFWQHPTRTKKFYSWVTHYFKMYHLTDKGLNDEHRSLKNLISDWGIFINHGYYVRNIKTDGVLSESEGKIVINPYFDKSLELMSQMRKDGDLYITTIRDLLDYWLLVDNISFDYMPDGEIYINNWNDKSIAGLSLAIRSDTVLIDGKIPKLKKVGKNTVFWFDIPAMHRIRMQVGQ